MTSVHGIKDSLKNGFNRIKTNAGKAYKNIGLGTIIAGERLRGIVTDTVQFAKAKPVKAGLIGLVSAAAIAAITKFSHIGIEKFKENKEKKKIENALNERNAEIVAKLKPTLELAEGVFAKSLQVIDEQAAEIEKLKETIETQKLVNAANQESIDAYHEALANEEAPAEEEKAGDVEEAA